MTPQTPSVSALFLCSYLQQKLFKKTYLHSLSPVFLFSFSLIHIPTRYLSPPVHWHSLFQITKDQGHPWWAGPWKDVLKSSCLSKQFNLKLYFKMSGCMWHVDSYQWWFRIISSKEALLYLFIVLSLHKKILCGVQAPIMSVQIQEKSLHAFLANVVSLTVKIVQQHC